MSLADVLEVHLREEFAEVVNFLLLAFQRDEIRHTAEAGILFIGLGGLKPGHRMKFRKAQRIDMDIVASPPKLGHDVSGEKFGVAAGHIHIDIAEAQETVEDPIEADGTVTVAHLFPRDGILGFIEQHIVLLVLINDPTPDVGGELLGVAKLLMSIVIEGDLDDVLCLYSISDEIITVDLEEEEAFARPPQAGQNFDQIIESPLNELLQIGIPRNQHITSNRK